MLFATTAAAKSAVMNSLRQASKQVVRSEQSVRIAVHQPAVPIGPATVMTTTRGMSMVEQMKSKEKVEEDRYMRELEAKFYERKRTEAKQEMAAQELKHYWETIAPVMVEVQDTLQSTGDDAGSIFKSWRLWLFREPTNGPIDSSRSSRPMEACAR